MGEGFELPQGIDTPEVEEFPRGDETSGVPIEGEGVSGEDGWGRGGNGNPPTNRETEARVASGGDERVTSGAVPAAPPIPQQGMAADRDSAGTLHRHSESSNGASPKHASKYGLLALAEPAGNPDAARIQVSGDGHGATRGTEGQGQRVTDTGDRTGQSTLLARGMP